MNVGTTKEQFGYKFILWCHDVHDKDWSIGSYTKLCIVDNLSTFWRLFNNLEKIGPKINNIFLMRNDTEPTWEHPNNRYGGICSLKVPNEDTMRIYTELCALLICNKLVPNCNDITGISITPKPSWFIIKIWNRDKNNDLSELLDDKYKKYNAQYKSNEPEY